MLQALAPYMDNDTPNQPQLMVRAANASEETMGAAETRKTQAIVLRCHSVRVSCGNDRWVRCRSQRQHGNIRS